MDVLDACCYAGIWKVTSSAEHIYILHIPDEFIFGNFVSDEVST